MSHRRTAPFDLGPTSVARYISYELHRRDGEPPPPGHDPAAAEHATLERCARRILQLARIAYGTPPPTRDAHTAAHLRVDTTDNGNGTFTHTTTFLTPPTDVQAPHEDDPHP